MTYSTIRNRANIANWYMVSAGCWVSGAGKTATIATRQQNGSWLVRSKGRSAVAKTLTGAAALFGKPRS